MAVIKALRLDKLLTEMGQGSRSEVKQEIKKGSYMVNGETVKKPELKVMPGIDLITDRMGKEISYQPFVYYMLHKPAGCVTACQDNNHETVMDLMKAVERKDLSPVGRLDKDTEGLLIITNDGLLSHELRSPKKHVEKTYYAKIDGEVTTEDVLLFEKGLDIGDEKPALPGKLRIIKAGEISEIELTISEGRYHQVKRMFEAVSKKVIYLKRLSMGGLTLDPHLETGTYRALTEEEIRLLKERG